MQGTKIKVQVGVDGTVSHTHDTGSQLLCAIVTPDPDGDFDGTFAEVAWNAGKYFTVKGSPSSRHIVTCIPSSSGPAPDGSPAPVFS